MSQVAFGKQRRNLILVSVVLIIYFIAGIEFTPESFFLSIRHENVVYVSVWLVFFYVWWRFYQFGADDQRCWKMDFLYELSKNRRYRKLYQQPETEGHDQHMVWAPALHGEGFRRYLSWDEAFLVGIRTGEGEIQFADASTFSESINPVSQKWRVGPETITRLKWRKYIVPAFKANLSALTNKSGSEWALPNILACFALICGISSLISKLI